MLLLRFKWVYVDDRGESGRFYGILIRKKGELLISTRIVLLLFCGACFVSTSFLSGVRDPRVVALALQTLKRQQQEQNKQKMKRALVEQRKRIVKHNNTTRGTGKKHPFGEQRTVPVGKKR